MQPISDDIKNVCRCRKVRTDPERSTLGLGFNTQCVVLFTGSSTGAPYTEYTSGEGRLTFFYEVYFYGSILL